MKIYTKTGDMGETGLIGGTRVPKNDDRIQAIGDIDELNAQVGVVLATCHGSTPLTMTNMLEQIQHTLFSLGADLAAPADAKSAKPLPRIVPADYGQLEKEIDALDTELPKLTKFILPGGAPVAAQLHLARAVCRRAERSVVALSKREKINLESIVYLNRLSDFLFVLSRYVNMKAGVRETKWGQK